MSQQIEPLFSFYNSGLLQSFPNRKSVQDISISVQQVYTKRKNHFSIPHHTHQVQRLAAMMTMLFDGMIHILLLVWNESNGSMCIEQWATCEREKECIAMLSLPFYPSSSRTGAHHTKKPEKQNPNNRERKVEREKKIQQHSIQPNKP